MEQQQYTQATVDTAGNVTGVAAGTAIISYTLGTCTATKIVTVYPTPPAIVTPGFGCDLFGQQLFIDRWNYRRHMGQRFFNRSYN